MYGFVDGATFEERQRLASRVMSAAEQLEAVRRLRKRHQAVAGLIAALEAAEAAGVDWGAVRCRACRERRRA
jgi:precorrin isomerase